MSFPPLEIFRLDSGKFLSISGTVIGSVLTNSGGVLTILFNSTANATYANEVIQSIAYSNTSNTPPSSVQIDWSMEDSNSGAQGSGGNLFATEVRRSTSLRRTMRPFWTTPEQ